MKHDNRRERFTVKPTGDRKIDTVLRMVLVMAASFGVYQLIHAIGHVLLWW